MKRIPRRDTPHAGAGNRARVALRALRRFASTVPLVLASASLLVIAGAAGAADAASARAEDVSVSVDDGQGTYRIRGSFSAPVSPALAWTVLTDYGHIGDYVKSMRASEVKLRGAGWLLLRQDASGGVFPLRRTVHVLLEVREEPGTRITFFDLMGQDFRHYSGEWVIHPGSPQVLVSYSLEARPVAAIPHSLGRGLMGREARELLQQVRAEMVRRAALTPAAEGRAL